LSTALSQPVDNKEILSKSLIKAGKAMGMSQTEIGNVIGKDRTSITRGIDPNSKAGELALLLIRCYRGLYVLVGGDSNNIKHWMHTENRHTGGIPAEQVQKVQGLNRVIEYIDAMRGKV